MPGMGISPEEEAEDETPFLADTIPALLEAEREVIFPIVAGETTPALLEAKVEVAFPRAVEETTEVLPEAREAENPRGGGSAESKPGLEPKGEYEDNPPFIVKFAHVMIVLLA